MSITYSIHQVIAQAKSRRASDIHIVRGSPIRIRIDGRLQNMDDLVLTAEDCEDYARQLSDKYDEIADIGELDLAISTPEGTRCRVNLFRQQGYVSSAIRILNDHIPNFQELGLPAVANKFSEHNQGIILITGETGSGKSTTQACILDKINHSQRKHIITLEDPIEYIYHADQCAINQREIGRDTRSFEDGMKAILREDPDVILIGEMRNRETIETALTAAETGHLVFATLHTNSAADSIDRIVDVFPSHQQPQIRVQLSMTLKVVMSQQLLPRISGHGRVLAYEVMQVNAAIRNMIREGKTPQIENVIATTAAEGNVTMDNTLIRLYQDRVISRETARLAARNPEYVNKSTRF